MDGIVKWFSRNHVAGNFLMFAILLAFTLLYVRLVARTEAER